MKNENETTTDTQRTLLASRAIVDTCQKHYCEILRLMAEKQRHEWTEADLHEVQALADHLDALRILLKPPEQPLDWD